MHLYYICIAKRQRQKIIGKRDKGCTDLVHSSRRPDGCLQYLTGIDGRLTTFNFNGVTPQHLDGQDYNICIRQEEGKFDVLLRTR